MEYHEKPKRKWQNLLHRKCPNCNAHLEEKSEYLVCPNPHATDEKRNCFFIKKIKAAEFLMDPNHPAHFCLSPHERITLEQTLREMGILEVR